MTAEHWLRTPRRTVALGAAAFVAVAAVLLAPGTPAHADPSTDQLDQQIQQQSQQFEQVVEQYNKLSEQHQATNAQINALDQRIAPLKSQVDSMQAQVGKLAARAFEGNHVGALNAMMTSGSPDSLLDNMSALEQMSLGQRNQVSSLTKSKAALDTQRKQLSGLFAQQSQQETALAGKKSKISTDIDSLKQKRQQAYGAAQESSSQSNSSGATPPAVSGRAGVVVQYAYAQLGKPYAWAQDGPDSFDCSGLTRASWRQAGVTLGHVVDEQWGAVAHIDRSQLQPGDLVFYEDLGHVALYIGNNQVIHAPTFGEVVKISTVDMMPPQGFGRPG